MKTGSAREGAPAPRRAQPQGAFSAVCGYKFDSTVADYFKFE